MLGGGGKFFYKLRTNFSACFSHDFLFLSWEKKSFTLNSCHLLLKSCKWIRFIQPHVFFAFTFVDLLLFAHALGFRSKNLELFTREAPAHSRLDQHDASQGALVAQS